ncbi:unnamed protein product [Tilletia controversa]|nr:unnamed protein product [Tilletia controversa]
MDSPASSASGGHSASPAGAESDQKPSGLVADPDAPLVSILCNPKSGSNVAAAGELTRPTVAIPVADTSADEGKSSSGVSPTTTFSAFKNAFSIGRKSSSNMRKQAKSSEAKATRPLGNSFKREGPLPVDEKGKIQGAPLLDVDPRTEEDATRAGSSNDPSSPDDSSSRGSANDSSVERESRKLVRQPSDSLNARSSQRRLASESGVTLTPPPSATRSGTGGLARSISNASSMQSGSSMSSASGTTRSGSVHAIRFCPLPATGRLKRANSITIGIAARSQMLLSQGNGPVPRGQQQSWAQGGPYQDPRSAVHPTDPRYSGFERERAAAWYEAGGQVPDDVIDVGAELRKAVTSPETATTATGTKTANHAPTSNGEGEHSNSSSRVISEGNENDAEADGMKTPRAKLGPPAEQSLVTPLTIQDNSHRADDTLEGSAVNRSSLEQAHAGIVEPSLGDTAASHFHRRVSTGAFLGNHSSLREMQSKRHNDLTGSDDEDAFEDAVSEQASNRASVEQSKAGLAHSGQVASSSSHHHTQDCGGESGDGLGWAPNPAFESAFGAKETKAPKKDAWDAEQKALAEAKIRQQMEEEEREEREEQQQEQPQAEQQQ